MTETLTLDSSSLRDIGKLKLIPQLVRLDFKLQTTTIACHLLKGEMRYETDIASTDGTLKVECFSDNEIKLIRQFNRHHPGITLSDCSVLYQAGRDHSFLLTSDHAIRTIALGMKIRVLDHSTLLGKMVEAKLLTIAEATDKYYELTAKVNKHCDTGPPVYILNPDYAVDLLKHSAG